MITTMYGDFYPQNGIFYSENFKKLEHKHFTHKVNYRKAPPLDEQISERRRLKKAMREHPDGNRCPSQFNQTIKLTS